MNYIALTINGPIEEKEAIICYLSTRNIDQFEEISYDVLEEIQREELSWDYLDESVLETEADTFIIRFYVTENEKSLADSLEEEIQKFQGCSLTREVIEEEDWANDWKQYFSAIEIAPDLILRPEWERGEGENPDGVIYINPGMAFGSGTHETTYMCMERIYDTLREGDRVFDIGCGSGILSLVAAKRGAKDVLAVDLDPVCISATRNNIALNHMEDVIHPVEGDLFTVVEGAADVIVSNLFAEIIVGMLPDVTAHLKPGGTFIASGILAEKKDLVKEEMILKGYTLLHEEVMGDWAALTGRLD